MTERFPGDHVTVSLHGCDATVDLAALEHNLSCITAHVPDKQLMAIVKGNAYGHGLAEVTQHLVGCGVTTFGVAALREALFLRQRGLPRHIRLLAWLYHPLPGNPEIDAAVTHRIDLSIGSAAHLNAVSAAARRADMTARVQLEFDCGLGRGGVPRAAWRRLLDAVSWHVQDGTIDVVGLWTHLSYADVPDDPANDTQLVAFRAAEQIAVEHGFEFDTVHTSSSARVLCAHPSSLYGDTVRIGLALFGVSPVAGIDASKWGLQPVLTVQAPIVQVKWMPAGARIGYEETHRMAQTGYVGLVPLGFADGIPTHGRGVATVVVDGMKRKIAGEVNMDQFMIELGPDPVAVGSTVTLLGLAPTGEVVDANKWEGAAGAFGDQIVSQFAFSIPRRYTDTSTTAAATGKGAAPDSYTLIAPSVAGQE